MNDTYDNLDIGELYTIDYLKNSGIADNSKSVLWFYKTKPRADLTADSPNVKKWEALGYTDTSPVVEIIYIWDSASSVQDIAYPSVFGDEIVASRIAQAVGKFDMGIDPDSTNLVTKTGTANFGIVGETGFENRLAIFSGTTANSEIRIEDTEYLRYAPGYELGAWFTAYISSAPTVDGKIEVGLMDINDGLGVAYKDVGNGLEFGFIQRSSGTETFVPQSEFNLDKADGTGSSGFNLDINSGNIFLIKAGYLGYAAPTLFVLNETNKLIPLHVINFPNVNTGNTIFSRTALPVSAYVDNGTTAENVQVEIGSYNAFVIDGKATGIQDRPFAKSTVQTILADGTFKNVIAFQNKDNAQLSGMPSSKDNRISAALTSLNVVFNDQSQAGVFRLIIIPSNQITATFTDHDTDRSIMRTATQANITTVDDTDAIELFRWAIPKTAGYELPPLSDAVRRTLKPNETAVFQYSINGGTSAELAFNNTWDELH